jgi:uncharacterized protein YjdB
MTFIAVTNITLSPDLTQLIVGQATTHTATVTPSNATNKSINWSRVSGVNATISQNTDGSQLTLTPQATGAIEIQATIANGKLQ